MRTSIAAGVLGLAMLGASAVDAATITGMVTGTDGAPFRGAFVQARNGTTKMTMSVLTDGQGNYDMEGLTAGIYRLQVRAPGYRADAKAGITLTADQNASFDFALQKGVLRWSDLSYYQGMRLLPDAKGKDVLFTNCMACHGFE